MNKDTFSQKVSLWLDDELTAAEANEMHLHLRNNPDYRQSYDGMKQVDRLLRDAAMVMIAPHPGFSHRFQTRLAHYPPRKLWQIWLALGSLLVGALILLGVYTVSGGLMLVAVSSSLLDAQLLFRGLVSVIDSADTLRFFLSFGALVLKTSFLTMKQPMFWGFMSVAILLTWSWVRVLQHILRRGMVTVNLLLF